MLSRKKKRRLVLAGLAFAASAAAGLFAFRQMPRTAERLAELYGPPLAAPSGPLNVFHIGHSLVGRDMPAMLAQLADHNYHSQLGWGTPLKDHWEPGLEINGFDAENNHPRYRDARKAVASGEYDALVLTEMVEIEDAIRYHSSPDYVALWTDAAFAANPDARVYLYETWHQTDDPRGWLTRVDEDLGRFWQSRIIHPAMLDAQRPIHLIPGGQVMAAAVRAIESGAVEGMSSRNDLFSVAEDGTPDTIHFNDIGAYLIALTHYAVLYHASPIGLPHALTRADGTPAQAPTAAAARVLQGLVWDVVQAHPVTGVAAQ